jgi:type II secretion system protein H
VRRARARSRARRRGFTLIEILAVVAILALTAVFVLPNLGALGERRVQHAALRLAAELELARQRAVVTGIPHRVLFDLQNGAYRIEWLGNDEAEEDQVPAGREYDVQPNIQLSLQPPIAVATEFTPVPDTFGNFRNFDGDVVVAGLQTANGWVEKGLSDIVFERDGSASFTEIVLQERGGARRTLAVLPLDDAVRFVDEEPKS